jgi:hypothetical protein
MLDVLQIFHVKSRTGGSQNEQIYQKTKIWGDFIDAVFGNLVYRKICFHLMRGSRLDTIPLKCWIC